jgi:hypothetical protein
VSEDLTGQFGLCGYFKEFDHDLAPEERLQFAPDETPPPFDPAQQPAPPDEHWSAERLAKAARNYAMEYCRNGIRELSGVIGRERAVEIGKRAGRLTGLQNYKAMADALGCEDGDVAEAARFLGLVMEGMGDAVQVATADGGQAATVRQSGLRIVRDMDGQDRADMLACWIELWRGAIASHRMFMNLDFDDKGDALHWRLSPRN